MSALVKKEIRLLLPTWIGCAVLALLSACFLPKEAEIRFLVVGSSCIVLAAVSYGREFSCGTFALLLTQPVSRRRIWKTKTSVLAIALGGLVMMFVAGQKLTSAQPYVWVNADLLLLTAAVTGGFCAALLFRQTFAAICLAWLVPLGMLESILLLSLFFPFENAASEKTETNAFYQCSLVLYTIVAAWGSWHLYARAQDLPALGEKTIELSLPSPRRRTDEAQRSRKYAPFRALLDKEFRLHLPGFIAMGGLFLVHLTAFAALKLPHNPSGTTWNALLSIVSNLWMAWLPIPILLGCSSIAEEQKLGMLEAQFCLPPARVSIFALKLSFALAFGGLLPAVLFHLLDPSQIFTKELLAPAGPSGFSAACRIFIPLAFAGFFASTLTRQVTSAFLIGIAFIFIFDATANQVIGHAASAIDNHVFWQGPMGSQFMLAAMLLASPWLAWKNFCEPQSIGANWQRTIMVGFLAIFAGPAVLATAIYHRPWDRFTSAAFHGAARLPMTQTPTISGSDELILILSDGRLWRSGLEFFNTSESSFGSRLLGPKFEEGSNWGKAFVGYSDIYALRSDGTIWSAHRPGTDLVPDSYHDPVRLKVRATLAQYGTDRDWTDVLAVGDNAFLLKKDGSLWMLGPDETDTRSQRKRGARAFEAHRLNAESDWKRLFLDCDAPCLEKTNGEVWTLSEIDLAHWWKSHGQNFGNRKPWRETADEENGLAIGPNVWIYRHPLVGGVEVSRWKSFSKNASLGSFNTQRLAGVRDDGTLWAWATDQDRENLLETSPVRVGTDANWQTVANCGPVSLALKTDGTIWKLNPVSAIGSSRLKKLDPHSDWVALETAWAGTLSLARDGSLWRWESGPSTSDFGPFEITLSPSRRPTLVANIFGASNPPAQKP